MDRACVSWCKANISHRYPPFQFRHCDIANVSYNPHGSGNGLGVLTDLPGHSFDLIVATSLFTHLMPAMMEQYIELCAHLLAPGGAVYASFFLFGGTTHRQPDRCGILFPHDYGIYRTNRSDRPTNAVAFRGDYVLGVAQSNGLLLKEPVRYGLQDILVFKPN